MSDYLKFGLNPQVVESLKSLFSKHQQIEKVIVYGSRAKGNFKVGSDIDLTLIGKELDLSFLLKVENEIDDLMLPYKVDISLYHQIEDQGLVEHIQRVGQPLF